MGVVRSAALEALGPEAALSKSTASRICQVLKTDFEVFQNRDPDRHRFGLPVSRRVAFQDA